MAQAQRNHHVDPCHQKKRVCEPFCVPFHMKAMMMKTWMCSNEWRFRKKLKRLSQISLKKTVGNPSSCCQNKLLVDCLCILPRLTTCTHGRCI